MKHIENEGLFSLYVFFGILIIIGYVLMYKKSGKEQNDLWTNNGKNSLVKNSKMKYFYIFMIFLSMISGIYLIYYLSTIQIKNMEISNILYTGSILLLLFSTIWAYLPFYNNILVLGLVSMGALFVLIGICLNKENDPKTKLALTAISILFIQTFFFDFLFWTGLVKI